MGTTRTALTSKYGGNFGFSLIISGYEYILTDAGDASKVVTAYAGTSWSAALPGLKVNGVIKQSMQPWADDFDVPTMNFLIMNIDGNDTFGKAVWKTKATFKTRLTAAFEPTSGGVGTMTVQSQAALGASGSVYAGNRKYNYASKTGTTDLDISEANSMAVFEAGTGNKWAPPLSMPGGFNTDIAGSHVITDIPGQFAGRHVALYLHRIVGGVWDTRGQAQLEFAGRISDIADTSDGHTMLICKELRQDIRNAVIGKKQWKGYVDAGFDLAAGTTIVVYETRFDVLNPPTTKTVSLKAATSPGTDEIQDGPYTYEQLLSAITKWLAEKTVAADLVGDMGISASGGTGNKAGVRTEITYSQSGADQFKVVFSSNSRELMHYLGFRNLSYLGVPSGLSGPSYATGNAYVSLGSEESGDVLNGSIIADSAPGYHSNDVKAGTILTLTQTEGSWFGNGYYLPAMMRNYGSSYSLDSIGVVQVNKKYFLVAFVGDTLTVLGDANSLVKQLTDESHNLDATLDDDNPHVAVKQVYVIAGEFKNIVTYLLASTVGNGGNHDYYDIFPFGAAIPWDLLGDAWVNSVTAVQEASGTGSMTLFIDKPTRLLDVLAPEFLLRACWLVFKDGGYVLTVLPTPSSATADHTLTESNKASVDGNADLSTSSMTDEHLRNVIKIEYFKQAGGDYLNTLTIKDQTSIELFGERAITVEARNVYGTTSEMGTSVEALAVSLSAKVFPHFAKPLKTITRTIAPSLYHMTPGDTVSVTDNHARSPESGERGLTARAGVVLSVAHDYGHEGGDLYGEATILLSDEDRTYPLSPSVEIDGSYTSGLYTNGYDSTNFRLRVKEHQFSESTASEDVASFDDTYVVRILELDPANTASPDAWTRTIDRVSTADNYIQFTASIGSPAWSGTSTKRMIVIPATYSATVAAQKTRAFQADKGDGFIENVIGPNVYGEPKAAAFTAGVGTDLPALLADETYGDGKPLSAAHVQNYVVAINNLSSYKCAPHMPVVKTTVAATIGFVGWEPSFLFPFYIGPIPPPGWIRYLKVAPFMKTNNADGTASCRVTAARFPPVIGPGDVLEFGEQVNSVTFTTTSTTYEEATVQDLIPLRGTYMTGHTFLVVEIQNSNVARLTSFRGLSTLYLGPLVRE